VILFSYLVLSVTEDIPLYAFIALALAGFVTAMIFWHAAGSQRFVRSRSVFPATTHSQKE
jgi:hypothetical protein